MHAATTTVINVGAASAPRQPSASTPVTLTAAVCAALAVVTTVARKAHVETTTGEAQETMACASMLVSGSCAASAAAFWTANIPSGRTSASTAENPREILITKN
jgi:hypothetical protein